VPADRLIVPLALQVLVENAVKHNAVGADAPLAIDITLQLPTHAGEPAGEGAGAALHVHNALRPRVGLAHATCSAGVGLANLAERCRRVAGRDLKVTQDAAHFSVQVPLM
jgi:LytS/YehU family sensor histidine kinase